MFRFLHTSDLHLGKRFGQMPEALRGRLTEARHGAIGRLAETARSGGAEVVLVAGDVFDSETPARATIRQALQAMAAAAPLCWVLMPGNHDSLAADELWARVRAECPPNVFLALSPAPIALGAAVVLPAPPAQRRPGDDPTRGMDAEATPAGVFRIGLAHGAVQSFGEEVGADVIAPDRAARAGLDWLALGDWHGQLRIGPRTWYAGTPEPDRFRHDAPGRALLVELPGPEALPVVTPVETGLFRWRTLALDLVPGDDPAELLAAALPPEPARRATLLRVAARGRFGLPGRAALGHALAEVEPDLAYLQRDLDDLATAHAPGDLDAIDTGGALRRAAEALLAEATDPARDPEARAVAAAALERLHEFATGEAET